MGAIFGPYGCNLWAFSLKTGNGEKQTFLFAKNSRKILIVKNLQFLFTVSRGRFLGDKYCKYCKYCISVDRPFDRAAALPYIVNEIPDPETMEILFIGKTAPHRSTPQKKGAPIRLLPIDDRTFDVLEVMHDSLTDGFYIHFAKVPG